MKKLMCHMTWPEYQASIKGGFIILVVGATEQHAHHLPLGVDTFISEGIAKDIADRLPQAVIGPVLSYGYKSQPTVGGGPLFPGTIDLSGNTLTNLVQDILSEFLADGWQKILILNGHYENVMWIMEAADRLLRRQEAEFPKVLIGSWWDNVSPAVLSKIFDEVEFAGWELEHAGITETSLMMHYAPESVYPDRMVEEGIDKPPSFQQFPVSRNLIPPSGMLHTARTSSADKGRILAEDIVNNMIKWIKKEFKL